MDEDDLVDKCLAMFELFLDSVFGAESMLSDQRLVEELIGEKGNWIFNPVKIRTQFKNS